ncbi:hypothetical protein Trihar35433_7807 [Trichoderma harzianum]|nr:hypothetical protein Trihar35433_7807 [Trichoderma harzianum]
MEMGVTETTSYQDLNIAYYTNGSGRKALVFIHGWSCSSVLWVGQGALSRQHRAIFIDLPGHGKSSAPQTEYSHEFFARAIKAVLENENLTQCVLVAHSLGGPIATMLLRLYPSTVASIVYVDSFFINSENYLPEVDRKKLAERLQDDEYFEAKIEGFGTERTTAEVRAAIRSTMLKTKTHVRVNAITTNFLPHAWRWEDVYDIPALLIATPRLAKIDQQWLHHLPQLKISVWEGHGHFLFMEDCDRFNAEVQEFLEKHSLG